MREILPHEVLDDMMPFVNGTHLEFTYDSDRLTKIVGHDDNERTCRIECKYRGNRISEVRVCSTAAPSPEPPFRPVPCFGNFRYTWRDHDHISRARGAMVVSGNDQPKAYAFTRSSTYDQTGLLRTVTHGGQMVLRRDYNQMGWLVHEHDRGVERYWQYNDTGDVVGIVDEQGTNSSRYVLERCADTGRHVRTLVVDRNGRMQLAGLHHYDDPPPSLQITDTVKRTWHDDGWVMLRAQLHEYGGDDPQLRIQGLPRNMEAAAGAESHAELYGYIPHDRTAWIAVRAEERVIASSIATFDEKDRLVRVETDPDAAYHGCAWRQLRPVRSDDTDKEFVIVYHGARKDNAQEGGEKM